MAADYFCIECGLPGEILVADRDPDWHCWACRGPIVSDFQLAYWNNLPFRAMLLEAVAKMPVKRERHVYRLPVR